MTDSLGAVCDEFHISSRLLLKLELDPGRETVLHFFDRIRKEYSRLTRLRRRDNGSYMLEEEQHEQESRKWIRLDPNGLRFGHFAPSDREESRGFGELILTQAPYHFSFNDLDYDHLEVTYGFDLEYRGNHDQLVAETLFGDNQATSFLFGDRAARIIDAQPYFGIGLTPGCDLQAYVEVKSRTTTYEVRNEAYEGAPISVFLTVRKYWNAEGTMALADTLRSLFQTADELATERIVPNFVNTLAAAIASRS
jgi:hypothetical protein